MIYLLQVFLCLKKLHIHANFGGNTHTVHTYTVITHRCFVPKGCQLYLADKSQRGIAVVLPRPQHSGIPGIDNRVNFIWCYWTYWGERVKQQSVN